MKDVVNENKKKKEIVIINKFKENEIKDVNELLERAFKIYYEIQLNKK